MAVLLNVNLAVEVRAHLLNDLAALADDILDLVNGDHHAEHLGRVLGQLGARLGDDRLDDLVKDVQTALAALLEGFLDDVVGQAVDFNVHLDGGDAAAGAADLEVHVAVEVLNALNVQHRHPAPAVQRVAVGDKAAGNARNGCLDGHTGIHQSQRGAADGRLGGGAVGGQDLGDAADGIRELGLIGQDGNQCALSQVAVADLAAARAAGCAGLADGVRREVVVVDVALVRRIRQVVHELGVLGGAKGADGQDLGLAAGEHAGPVHTGQQTDLGGQRADLVDAAAIDALAVLQQPGADDLLLQLVADEIEVGGGQLGVLGGDGIHNGQHRGVADVLVVGVHRGLNVLEVVGVNVSQQGVVKLHGGEALFRLADLGDDAVDERQHLPDLLVTGADGLHHGLLVDLVGTGLDHDDLFLAGGQRQGEVAVLALLLRGVQHDLAVHQTDKHTGNRAVPGNIRHGDGQGRTVHAGNFGRAVGVLAHDGHGHADIVAHILGEQRADGAVHNAGGQDGVLAGAALTAHEAARDAACGVEFLLKLDAQGEEIDAVAGLVAHRDVAEHAGLAVADHGAAVGQTAHFAGLDHKRAARKGRLELAVVGEGFQSGCEFVSHRDSPSLVDFYFQRSPAPVLYNKASSQACCLGARFTAQNAAGRL